MHTEEITSNPTLRADALARGELVDLATEPTAAVLQAAGFFVCRVFTTRAAFDAFVPEGHAAASFDTLAGVLATLRLALGHLRPGDATTWGHTPPGTDGIVFICAVFDFTDDGIPAITVMLAAEHFATVDPSTPGASSFAPYV